MISNFRPTSLFRFRIGPLFALLALWSSFANGAPIPITSGQLVNLRVGNGTTTPAAAGLPVTLDVYNITYTSGSPTSISLAQSISLPTAASGIPPTSGNRYLTQSGNSGAATAEGGLTLSLDGRYMALGGYNTTVGGATTGSGNSGQRVVGLLDLSTGAVDTTTNYTDAITANQIRNAFTTDGTDIWTANSAIGVRYITAGGSTSTALSGTASERRVYIYPTASGNQLYTSRTSSPVLGTVGSGPAAKSGTQTVTAVPLPTASSESAYDYFFANANTLYIGDDVSSSSIPGGLQKYIFDGTNWTRAFNLQVNPAGSATKGLRSLTGTVDASGNVTLFGATTDNSANYLYGFRDTLANTNVANVVAKKLVTAGTDFSGGGLWNLRGVALATAVPEPATLVLLACGCAASCVVTRRVR